MRGVVSIIIQILPIISTVGSPYLYEYLDGATLDSLPVVFPPAEELEKIFGSGYTRHGVERLKDCWKEITGFVPSVGSGAGGDAMSD